VTIFERRLLARFLARCLLLLALTAWLTLAIQLSRRAFTAGELLAALRDRPYTLEIALGLGAPLAMVTVILSLKRSGILTVFLASGMPPTRIRRVLLVAALLVSIASAVLLEVSPTGDGPDSGRKGPIVHRTGDSLTWHVPADPVRGTPDRRVHFHESDLLVRVETAMATAWPAETTTTTTVSARSRPLRPPSLFRSLGSRTPVRSFLAALLRVLTGGALLLLCSGVALAAPVSRPLRVYLLYVALALATVFGTVYSLISLWSGTSAAFGFPVFWIAAYPASILVLDRVFNRRGYRLA